MSFLFAACPYQTLRLSREEFIQITSVLRALHSRVRNDVLAPVCPTHFQVTLIEANRLPTSMPPLD